jgi:hypothetical protein
MGGVRGGDEGFPVELWDDQGRIILRGINEGGFACVDIDLGDVVEWIGIATNESLRASIAAKKHNQ